MFRYATTNELSIIFLLPGESLQIHAVKKNSTRSLLNAPLYKFLNAISLRPFQAKITRYNQEFTKKVDKKLGNMVKTGELKHLNRLHTLENKLSFLSAIKMVVQLVSTLSHSKVIRIYQRLI